MHPGAIGEREHGNLSRIPDLTGFTPADNRVLQPFVDMEFLLIREQAQHGQWVNEQAREARLARSTQTTNEPCTRCCSTEPGSRLAHARRRPPVQRGCRAPDAAVRLQCDGDVDVRFLSCVARGVPGFAGDRARPCVGGPCADGALRVLPDGDKQQIKNYTLNEDVFNRLVAATKEARAEGIDPWAHPIQARCTAWTILRRRRWPVTSAFRRW